MEDSVKLSQSGGSTEADKDIRVVYFSSVTDYTHRFVSKLGFPSERIPLLGKDPMLEVDYDYVLFVPTYGAGKDGGAVPKQVVKFLNIEHNRNHCKGVIASGNTNFGTAYCLAGKKVASKLQVPLLYMFELLGTMDDVVNVQEGLRKVWKDL